MADAYNHADPAPHGYYSVAELRARWGCGRTKIYDVIHAPGFPPPLRVGRTLRFARHEVWEFEAAQLADPRVAQRPALPPRRRPGPGRRR